jgi:hypothetical protein
MTAYKLLKKRKDGTLGPLFINCSQRIPIGEMLQAEAHRRKGYKFRPGWHCMCKPEAPHLTNKGRVWCEVEILEFEEEHRPESQGGLWYLAQKMRVTRELQKNEIQVALAP